MVNTGAFVRELEATKRDLKERADEDGLWENFGQKEARELEDKYSEIIDPYAQEGTKEYRNHKRMQSFRRWARNYSPYE